MSCILSATLALTLAGAPDPTDAKAIDAIVAKAMADWHVPGVAVAIVRDGDVLFSCHGVREAAGRDPVTPDTLFPLASCSKAFTTTAMAMLVDEGKMAWDDPVRKHLPWFRLADPLADRAVILRDLLCHRTGLGTHDLLWYRAPWTPAEAVRRAGLLPLDKPFRSAFQYQSTMFTAAGLAVSSAAGMPWHDFVRARILEPLEMKSTCFTSTEALKFADRARGHRINELGNVVSMPTAPMSTPDAAWTIQSTARDLARWARFHLGDGTSGGKRLVSKRNLDETHAPQMVIPLAGLDRDLHPETVQMSYAMAWVVQDFRGEKLVSHAGALDGFRAHITLLPRRGVGIIILSNLQGTRMNLALSNTLVDHLLGKQGTDWTKLYLGLLRREAEAAAAKEKDWQAKRVHNTKPAHALAEYAGNYEHPAYGVVEVKVEGRGLVWHWNAFRGPLEHHHFETFVLRELTLQNPVVLFEPGPTGEVATMRVQGAVDAKFTKQKR